MAPIANAPRSQEGPLHSPSNTYFAHKAHMALKLEQDMQALKEEDADAEDHVQASEKVASPADLELELQVGQEFHGEAVWQDAIKRCKEVIDRKFPEGWRVAHKGSPASGRVHLYCQGKGRTNNSKYGAKANLQAEGSHVHHSDQKSCREGRTARPTDASEECPAQEPSTCTGENDCQVLCPLGVKLGRLPLPGHATRKQSWKIGCIIQEVNLQHQHHALPIVHVEMNLFTEEGRAGREGREGRESWESRKSQESRESRKSWKFPVSSNFQVK